ncbi:hypothetical protein ABZ477_14835 [Microbacterium sp. NPDC019599]|uniref:hypothetical protein n=1 Tax=Microbacterium sp. NPDC019599 TaxID=3154690 RepID=UPI003407BDFF
MYSPPQLPDHTLRLINWSRSSRRVAGRPTWFLALPYSLLNVAGATLDRCEGGAVRTRLGGLVHVYGLLVSVVGLIWLMVIAETILDVVPGAGAEGVVPVVLGLIVAAYSTAIVWRGGRVMVGQRNGSARRERMLSGGVIAAHVIASVIVGAWVVLLRPTLLEVPATGLLETVTYQRLVGQLPEGMSYCQGTAELRDQFVSALNPLNAIIVLSVGFAFVGALALAVASILGKRPELAAAAVALVGSVVLANAFGGALRLALDWFLAYLNRYGWVSDEAGLGGRGRYVHGHDPACAPIGGDWIPNTVFANAVIALGILILSLVLVNLLGKRAAKWPRHLSRVEWDRYLHRLVGSLGERLGWAFLIGSALFVLCYVWIFTARADGGRGSTAFVVLTAHVGALVAVLLVFLNGRIRRVGAMVADVIGFWPIAWHPLAGRSYRNPVLASVGEDLHSSQRPVVVVGHSQGSILATWLCAGDGLRDRAGIALVTCGSPVRTLYGTFFPGYFNDELYADVTRDGLRWSNFWRDTDPIASPFGLAGCTDTQLPDPRRADSSASPLPIPRNPRPGGKVRPLGHSNYWTDPDLMNEVTGLLGSRRENDRTGAER